MRLADIYWDYDMVKLVDGCKESYYFDDTFVFYEVQEACPRHVMSFRAFDEVAGHELYSC